MTPRKFISEAVVTVQVSPNDVEVVEELTEEEATERHRLEQRVEKAFYQAGSALRVLRDKRLYRSTHRTFENYCLERFNYARRAAYCLISAADVVDNLLNCDQIDHILPTKESQCRPLAQLKPEEQRQVWQQAVGQSGGKVPSSRTVLGIVSRLMERKLTPPQIPFQQGDVVLVRGLGNPDLKKFDGQWAIVLRINEYSVTVALGGKDTSVKPQFLEPVDPKDWADIKVVHERITRLQQNELDPMEEAGLEVLLLRTCFTPKQMILLKFLEQQYGIE